MLAIHSTFENADEACVHLIKLVFRDYNRIQCLRHDKNVLRDELDQLKKTHKRVLQQKRHANDAIQEHEAQYKRARKELREALVPGYERARDDPYVRDLLEKHAKRLKRFNLTPAQFADLDQAEQQHLATQQQAGASRPVADEETSPAHRRESQQLAGTGLPMHEAPERARPSVATQTDHDDTTAPDVSRINIDPLPALCDNCNAAIDPLLGEVIGTLTEESQCQVDLHDTATRQVMTAMRVDEPQAPDAEPWESGELESAPPAVCSRASKNKRTHDTWLNFTIKYVQAHYMQHLIGTSNLRYRDKSYSEHCHHRTVDWDNHPFCPACYIKYGLPQCSKYGPVSCGYCQMNSDDTDAKRNKLFGKGKKVVATANRDIPVNCYTQADCDAYIQANGYFELPNPDWLPPGNVIQGCIPGSLIPTNIEPKNYRAFVDTQVSWRNKAGYKAYCDTMNASASKGLSHTTPSSNYHPLVPKGLKWSEDDEVPRTSTRTDSNIGVEVHEKVTNIEQMISYMYGPLKAAEESLTAANSAQNQPSTLAAAVFRATDAAVAQQPSTSALPAPLGLSVLQNPPPALAALVSTQNQDSNTGAQITATRTTVETIRSCTPTLYRAVRCDFTCQFGPITENKTVQTDEEWMPRRYSDKTRAQPQRIYEAHGMKFGPWQGTAEQQLPDLYPLWRKQNDLTKRVRAMEDYGNETLEVKRRMADSNEVVTTKQLVIATAIPDEYDLVMAEAATSPFNITVPLPPKLTSQNTDESFIQGRDTANLPDQAGFFASATDVVPMTQHEARQHVVIAQMNANCTGWEAAVTQKLRGKLTTVQSVEDLRDEVADTLDFLQQRHRDKTKLCAAHLTLATLIPRRDLMIRCGLPPEKHPLLFANTEASASPLPYPRAPAILEDEVVRQAMAVDTTEEVRRRHLDVMYRDDKHLSDKGKQQRDDYLMREQQMREDRAKLLEVQAMHLTARRHTGSRMFESAVKLREDHINDKLRAEREKLLRSELAKLRSRPVQEFQQLRATALRDALVEAKAKIKQQDAEHAQQQRKTQIVREPLAEVKLEPPEDNNVSEQVQCSLPVDSTQTGEPAPAQPTPAESIKEQPWYENDKTRKYVAQQLARRKEGFDQPFYTAAAAIVNAVSRLNDRMRWMTTDALRQRFLRNTMRTLMFARNNLLDDKLRKAFDCVIMPVRTWVLNLNTRTDASRHLKTTLLVATNIYFNYYKQWYESEEAPPLQTEIAFRPEDDILGDRPQASPPVDVSPTSTEQDDSPTSDKVRDQINDAKKEGKKPTARMSTSVRAPNNPPYVYMDTAEDPAFQ